MLKDLSVASPSNILNLENCVLHSKLQCIKAELSISFNDDQEGNIQYTFQTGLRHTLLLLYSTCYRQTISVYCSEFCVYHLPKYKSSIGKNITFSLIPFNGVHRVDSLSSLIVERNFLFIRSTTSCLWHSI